MINYTTKTASLRVTTIDTRKIDTKQIDTEVLKLNGEIFTPFDPSTIETDVATKLTITLSSIADSTLSYNGYEISLISGVLSITKSDGDVTSWQPIQLTIEGNTVFSQFVRDGNAWKSTLWENTEDYTQLYGGLTLESVIEVVIIVNGVIDGNEDVMTTLSGYVLHNVVYHLGEMDTLELTLPIVLNENYASEVVFTSGETATVVTSDSRIKWAGDDIVSGAFTPIANVRYSCTLLYDGVFVRGMIFGISTE